MARISLVAEPGKSSLTFPNGTRLEDIPLEGSAIQLLPAAPGLRSAELPSEIDTSRTFDAALRQAGFEEQETIHLEGLPGSQLRSGATADTIVLRPAIPPGDTNRRVVLYSDESGGLTWHFAENSRLTPQERERMEARGLLRDEGTVTFRIPARTAAARASLLSGPPRGAFRGPITKIGRKILKVFVIPVAAKILEKPAELLATAFESRVHTYRIWNVTPDNYAQKPVTSVTDWAPFAGKPTLLIVHGIFSSVEGMLSKLPREVMQRWVSHYGGRVLAFNHPSVSLSPEDNARFFLESAKRALPTGQFQFDVLCHSRGGIVSRTLAERGRALFPESNCEFRSVYFVASPNQGSVLGNPEHMLDMVDVFTNLLTEFPDGHTLYALEAVLGVIKLLAYTAGVGLPGMASMAAGEQGYIASLNRSAVKSPARYAAAASVYAPRPGVDNGFFTGRFATHIMERIFSDHGKAVANDLVVPQQGVFAGNGHPSFPIADSLVYEAADGVWHSGFFAEPRTVAHIEEHLDMTPPTARDAEESAPRELIESADEAALAQPMHFGAEPPGEATSRSLRDGSREIAPATSQEMTLTLEPWIDFHELVREGEPNALVVKLADVVESAEIKQLLNLGFAAGEDQIDLSVELSAPGFYLDRRSYPLIVNRTRNPQAEQATFLLTAKHPGETPVRREIIASFYHDNDCVGAVTHETVVVPKNYTAPVDGAGQSTRDPIVVSSRPRAESDLILFIRKDNAQPDTYHVELKCNVPGQEYAIREMGLLDLRGTELSDLFSKVLDPLFRRFPSDPTLSDQQFNEAVDAWSTQFLAKLAQLGRRLWELLPGGFRDEYIKLMESDTSTPPRSICVYSDEMVLPWEMVRPYRAEPHKDYEPLGVAHVMARWMPSLGARPQPQSYPVREMVLLTPSYGGKPLVWAQKESAELMALLPFIKRPAPADLQYFEAFLDNDSAQIVHFNGHGEWDPSGELASLRVSDQDVIQALDFTGRRLGNTAHPILYLNACSVGRNNERLGQPGGFAATCLRGGWSGVIAPYWKVFDPQAMRFGVDLYRKLKAGLSIGEALQQLRRDQPKNFTAQSYCYFGDPYARLLIEAT